MQALTEEELAARMEPLTGWTLSGGKLLRKYEFADFLQAMDFVNAVAKIAEEAGHHPDIDIRYNQVTLGLVTHDAGGITERDVAMASALSAAF
jgi:4a-hydroxytetrahydrobiopterin dehydratase